MTLRKLVFLLCAVSLTAISTGCTMPDAPGDASGDAPGDDPTAALEGDFGGPLGLMAFFHDADARDIRAVLGEYGMDYTVHRVATEESKYIGDCPQYFPSSDRNTWHNFNGEYYYIDSSGRPYKAYAYMPPIVSESRSTSCQSNVGQWGDAENSWDDYDGGHMIGSQLGGWGKRANLVPQDLNFNRGNWKSLENQMAECNGLPSGRMFYYVRANYSNSSDLVPSTMNMMLENRSTGSDVWLSFENVYQGGSSGTSEKSRGVDFLKSNGCD